MQQLLHAIGGAAGGEGGGAEAIEIENYDYLFRPYQKVYLPLWPPRNE